MKRMHRCIAVLIIIIMLLGMTACCIPHGSDATPTATTPSTQPTQESKPTETPNVPLTTDGVIDRLTVALALAGFTQNTVSHIETKDGDIAGQKIKSFTYLSGYVALSIWETNGVVDYMMVTALPSRFQELVPGASKNDLLAKVYAITRLPLQACEPRYGGDWHTEQWGKAPDEGDSTVSIRSYKSSEWLYLATISEYFVTSNAIRYCQKCGSNATKVTFTPGTTTCDSCNNNKPGNGNSGGNNNTNVDPTAPQPTTCSHTYTDATCTQPKTCTKCGQTTGSALGHTYSASASCTEPAVCNRCGETTGAPIGHTYGAAACTSPATCNRCGQTSGTALGHTYSAATCTSPATCNRCGQTTGTALGHTYSAATCTSPATCSRCGQKTGTALGHTYADATCTAAKTCTICHETWGSANGHSWREATCTAPKTCQFCKTTEGSALPHSMYDTICIKCGYADFSKYTLTSNSFCLDSWFKLDGARSQYLEDGEASINIDSKGVCKVSFDQYSYTFTLKQTGFGNEPVFECYLNGERVKTAVVTFYYSQNRCDFFLYGGALGFSQVALNFDM